VLVVGAGVDLWMGTGGCSAPPVSHALVVEAVMVLGLPAVVFNGCWVVSGPWRSVRSVAQGARTPSVWRSPVWAEACTCTGRHGEPGAHTHDDR
jgi:hypothetical protein